jgi:hypothetical protein
MLRSIVDEAPYAGDRILVDVMFDAFFLLNDLLR